MRIKIVKAVPRDAYALSVLTKEYFDYARLTHAKILERLKSPNYEYWLARDARSGALAGFIDVDFTPVRGIKKEDAPTTQQTPMGVALGAKARREAKPKGTRTPAQAKILGLAVLPEFRGRGVAKRLIAKATARAKARGCKEIFLLVREDNAAAQALYAKLGFALRGALAEKLWNQRILLYAKELKKE